MSREQEDGSTLWGGCYDHEQPVDSCSSCKWQLEKRFWASLPKLERFGLEYAGSYSEHRDMVRDETGDWIRAEDFRAEVERLRALVKT